MHHDQIYLAIVQVTFVFTRFLAGSDLVDEIDAYFRTLPLPYELLQEQFYLYPVRNRAFGGNDILFF